MNNSEERQEQFEEAEIADLPGEQSNLQQAFPGAESLSGGPDDLPSPEETPATEEISEAELSEAELPSPFELEWRPVPGSEQGEDDNQGRKKALVITAAVIVAAFAAFILLNPGGEQEPGGTVEDSRLQPPEAGSANEQIVKQRPGSGAGGASAGASPKQQLQAATRLLEGQELAASLGKNSQKLAAELSRRLGIPVVAGNRRPKQGLAVTIAGDNVLIFPPRNAPPEVFEKLVSAQWKK